MSGAGAAPPPPPPRVERAVAVAGERARAGHAARVFALALAAGAPALVTALYLLARGRDARVLVTLGPLLLGAWLALALAARRRVVRSMQTLASVLAAYREGDFSVRAREDDPGGTLGAVVAELNALGETLRAQRLGALEAWALLRKVMAEIDVAVFAFDPEGVVRLANVAGERLVGRPAAAVVGRPAADAGLAELLDGAAPRTVATRFAGGAAGPWELRRGSFQLAGRPHRLVVLADLGPVLRQQEREAWQRLVRVLGHEINNSLAPIQSISDNLARLLARPERGADWEGDLAEGLDVIGRRSGALARFMGAYASLARLPPPRPGTVDVAAWVRRTAALEQRLSVQVAPGPDVTLRADGDQLEQLLINLVRNAADAALETGGAVRVRWSLAEPGWFELAVEDEGPGVAETANLFVPFFTTKPQGSGIGLALARQIAEAHRGTLALEGRADGARGAVARLRLPA